MRFTEHPALPGILIATTTDAEPGDAYLFNPAAFRATSSWSIDADPYASTLDEVAWRVREEFAFELRRTVPERDPALRPMPRAPTLRRLLADTGRRTAAIVGYEYRKAAGRPRRQADPRDFVKLTGLTS